MNIQKAFGLYLLFITSYGCILFLVWLLEDETAFSFWLQIVSVFENLTLVLCVADSWAGRIYSSGEISFKIISSLCKTLN